MKNYIQKGNTITLTAPANVVSGQPLKVGQFFGVVVADALSGQPMELCLEGVFELVKKTADTPSEGSALYWDPTPGELTTTKAATNQLVGAAVAAAGNTATVVKIRLNGIAFPDEA